MEDAFDAVIVGAGFSGLYALHKLRQLGLRTRAIELGDGVGGTWLWNRYPGARCDIESIEYSYSFEEIQQEWAWTDSMPGQPEIEAYLNFVADRLDLRRDIEFNTRVTALTFEESDATWVVETDRDEHLRAPFIVAATGLLSVPVDPVIPGMDAFGGVSVLSSRYPRRVSTSAGDASPSSGPVRPVSRPRRCWHARRTTSTCSSARRPTPSPRRIDRSRTVSSRP